MGGKLNRSLSEFVGMTTLLVLVFLFLTHSTGAARVISSFAQGYIGITKAFQGR